MAVATVVPDGMPSFILMAVATCSINPPAPRIDWIVLFDMYSETPEGGGPNVHDGMMNEPDFVL
jgi:hypothetical protein